MRLRNGRTRLLSQTDAIKLKLLTPIKGTEPDEFHQVPPSTEAVTTQRFVRYARLREFTPTSPRRAVADAERPAGTQPFRVPPRTDCITGRNRLD